MSTRTLSVEYEKFQREFDIKNLEFHGSVNEPQIYTFYKARYLEDIVEAILYRAL